MPQNTPPGSPKSKSDPPELPLNAPETPPNPPPWEWPELEQSPPKLGPPASKPDDNPFVGDFSNRPPTDLMEKFLESKKTIDPEQAAEEALLRELTIEASVLSSEEGSPPPKGYGQLAPLNPDDNSELGSSPRAPSVGDALGSMQLPLREGQSVVVRGTGSPYRIKEREALLSPLREEHEKTEDESPALSEASVPETVIRRSTSTRTGTPPRARLSRTVTGLESSVTAGPSRVREELRSRKSFHSDPAPTGSRTLSSSLSPKGKEVKRRPEGLERRITESQALRERINTMVATGTVGLVMPAPESRPVTPERPAPSRTSSIISALNWVLSRPSPTTSSDWSENQEWQGSEAGDPGPAAHESPRATSEGDDLPESSGQAESAVERRDWRRSLLRRQRAGRGNLSVAIAPQPEEPGLLTARLNTGAFPATPRASAGEFLTEIQERVKRGIEHLKGDNEAFTFENLLDAIKTAATKDYNGGEPFGDNKAITQETLKRVLAEIDSGEGKLDLNTRQQNRHLRDKLEAADEYLYDTLANVNVKEEQIQELERVVENLEAERNKLHDDVGKLNQSLKDNQELVRQYTTRGKVDESARFKQLQADYDHLNGELEYSEEERAKAQAHIEKLESEIAGWTRTARVWENYSGSGSEPSVSRPSESRADGAALAEKDKKLKRLVSALEKLTYENNQIKAKLASAEKASTAFEGTTIAQEQSWKDQASEDQAIKDRALKELTLKNGELKNVIAAMNNLSKEYSRVKGELDQFKKAQSSKDQSAKNQHSGEHKVLMDQHLKELAAKDEEVENAKAAFDNLSKEYTRVKGELDKSKTAQSSEGQSSKDQSSKNQHSEEDKVLKEQHLKELAAKDEEIENAKAALDDLSKDHVRVKAELDRLTKHMKASNAAAASRGKILDRLADETDKLSKSYSEATPKLAEQDAATAMKDKELKRLAAETAKLAQQHNQARIALAKVDEETAQRDKELELIAQEIEALVQELKTTNKELKAAKAKLAKVDEETVVRDEELELIAQGIEDLTRELKTKKRELKTAKKELSHYRLKDETAKKLLAWADDRIYVLEEALKASNPESSGRKAAGDNSGKPSTPKNGPPKEISSQAKPRTGGRQEPPSDPGPVYHEPCQNCVSIYLYHPDSYLQAGHSNSTTTSPESEPKPRAPQSSPAKPEEVSVRPSEQSAESAPSEPCCEHINLLTGLCDCQGKCPAHPCCAHWEQGSGCACVDVLPCPDHDCCGHYDRETKECGCDERCDLHPCCEHFGGGKCHCDWAAAGSTAVWHDARHLKDCPTWTPGYCNCCGKCSQHGACEHWKMELDLYYCEKPCELRDLTGECEHPVNEDSGRASCEHYCDEHPCCRHYNAGANPPLCTCGGRCREHRCCEHWKQDTRTCNCGKTCQVHKPEDYPPRQPEPKEEEGTASYAKRRTSHFVSSRVRPTWKQSPIPTTVSQSQDTKAEVERQRKISLSESIPRPPERAGGSRDPPSGPSWTRNTGPPPIIGYVCLDHQKQAIVTRTRREIYLAQNPGYFGQLFGNIFDDPPDSIWQLLLCILFLPVWWLYNFGRLVRRQAAQPLPKLLPKNTLVSVTRLVTFVYVTCLFIALKEERRIWLRANGATAAYLRDMRARPPFPWWSPVEADPRLLEPWLGEVTDTLHRYFFARPSATATVW